jgi:hypothetical protein
MPATLHWIILKSGKPVKFKTRAQAEDWIKKQPEYPKGRYHIYNNMPVEEAHRNRNARTKFFDQHRGRR